MTTKQGFMWWNPFIKKWHRRQCPQTIYRFVSQMIKSSYIFQYNKHCLGWCLNTVPYHIAEDTLNLTAFGIGKTFLLITNNQERNFANII